MKTADKQSSSKPAGYNATTASDQAKIPLRHQQQRQVQSSAGGGVGKPPPPGHEDIRVTSTEVSLGGLGSQVCVCVCMRACGVYSAQRRTLYMNT